MTNSSAGKRASYLKKTVSDWHTRGRWSMDTKPMSRGKKNWSNCSLQTSQVLYIQNETQLATASHSHSFGTARSLSPALGHSCTVPWVTPECCKSSGGHTGALGPRWSSSPSKAWCQTRTERSLILRTMFRLSLQPQDSIHVALHAGQVNCLQEYSGKISTQ